MRPERDLLRLLAAMPFLDRLEMVAVSGWSRGAIYGSIEAIEEAGLAASVPHASELIPSTRRYCLTAAGLRRLAREEDVSVDELLRLQPVSEQWRRLLLQRLDAVAAIYRLAAAVSDIAYPIRFRWYRAMPMDAAIALPDGRTVAVVRQGHTADRTAFAKRLWRLREGPRLGAFLLLAPDDVAIGLDLDQVNVDEQRFCQCKRAATLSVPPLPSEDAAAPFRRPGAPLART